MRKEELFSRPSINWLLLQSRVSAARLTARRPWAVTAVPGIPARAGGRSPPGPLSTIPASRPPEIQPGTKAALHLSASVPPARAPKDAPPVPPSGWECGPPATRKRIPSGSGTSKFSAPERGSTASTSLRSPQHSRGQTPGVHTQRSGLERGGNKPLHLAGQRLGPEQVRPHTVPRQRRQGPGPRPGQRAGEGGNGSEASSGFSPARGSPPWRRNVTLTRFFKGNGVAGSLPGIPGPLPQPAPPTPHPCPSSLGIGGGPLVWGGGWGWGERDAPRSPGAP